MAMDRLITLHALAALPTNERTDTAALLEREGEGLEKMLRMLRWHISLNISCLIAMKPCLSMMKMLNLSRFLNP